jgi:predicted peptidase
MIFVTPLVLLLPALATHAQAAEQAGTFSTVLRCRETLNYLVSRPRRYQESASRWPVILYLHGAGDRGNDLNLVKRQGPPYEAEREPDFPFIVVSPRSVPASAAHRGCLGSI